MPAKYSPRAKQRKADEHPTKPDDCLLYPHASGHWAKTIRGKFYYFDPWHKRKMDKQWERLPDDGLHAALKKFSDQFSEEANGVPAPQSGD